MVVAYFGPGCGNVLPPVQLLTVDATTPEINITKQSFYLLSFSKSKTTFIFLPFRISDLPTFMEIQFSWFQLFSVQFISMAPWCLGHYYSTVCVAANTTKQRQEGKEKNTSLEKCYQFISQINQARNINRSLLISSLGI